MNAFTLTPSTVATTETDPFKSFGAHVAPMVDEARKEVPDLKWYKGNLSTTNLKTAAGWYTPKGVIPELDEVLTLRGVESCTIEHQSGEEADRLKDYWDLNTVNNGSLSIIVVAEGLQTRWNMKQDPGTRLGIVYATGWSHAKDGSIEINDQGKQKQRIHMIMRVYIHELLGPEGSPTSYNKYFEWYASNFLCDDVFAALEQQRIVVKTFNDICLARKVVDGQGKPVQAPLYGFSLPLGLGTRKPVGNKDKKSQQSSVSQAATPPTPTPPPAQERKTAYIYPMRALTPDFQDGKAVVAYLNAHRIPDFLLEMINPDTTQEKYQGQETLLEQTIVWSAKESIRLAEIETSSSYRIEEEKPLEGEVMELPAPSAITTEQVAWITQEYCANDQGAIQSLLDHFKVQSLEQLTVAQYSMLESQLNGSQQ